MSELIRQELLKKYPSVTVYDDNLLFLVVNNISFEIYDPTTIIAYADDEEYDSQVKEILASIGDDVPLNQVPGVVIERLLSNLFDAAGFTEENRNPSYDSHYDYTELLKQTFTPERELYIVSFGEKFKSPKAMEQGKISNFLPFKCDCTFDARHINSAKPKSGNLRELRGTDSIIQKCIESGSGFEFVMRCIITSIEAKDPKVIGIYCTAGHHRSVALAELLKRHIYLKATNCCHLK